MKLNILIVDDSETMRTMIKKTIHLAGVPTGRIHEAGNGHDGLKKLDEEWVDLVILDLNMPVMSGVEMINRMSADGLLKTLPVIVVSSSKNGSCIDHLKAQGVCAFVAKPYTPELLKTAIARAVEEFQLAKEPHR